MADADLPTPPDGVRPELPDDATPADLDEVQRAWESTLAALLTAWEPIAQAWRESLVEQVRYHVAASDVVSLSLLTVDPLEGAAALETAMTELRNAAALGVVVEAAAQGVEDIYPAPLDRLWIAAVAQVWSSVLAEFTTSSAVREAMRVWPARTGGQAEGDRVAELVADHLESLTDAQPRLVLGGSLTAAQHDGRVQTMIQGPDAALYADEVLDKNTCRRCKAINRKWLGNASDADQVLSLYPVQGYVACEGGARCRGQVVAVWRGGTDWKKWVELPDQRTGA